MQVACKTGGAEQLEKEQKSADGDESDQQGGARRAVFNEEESSWVINETAHTQACERLWG